jgi:mannose-6-phosphate isomerase-like protein (cupin superfamily)
MTIKKEINQLKAFRAGDDTLIKEVLHPKNDGVPYGYSLAYASLEPGTASLSHQLMKSSETYVIHTGQGKAYVDGKAYEMGEGDTLFIPAGAEQWIENTGKTTLGFWCIVLPPWSEEQEEVKR